jgi:hypothetical protein
MIYIIFLITLIVGLFLYEIYKTFENEIADIAKKIRRIKILKNWFIFICDIFISAAQGIVTICLTALALVFATSVGLVSNLSDNDIINSNIAVLIFLGLYGIIVSTVFWYIKQKINKN